MGYVAGNGISAALPVTTTISHKAPEDWNLYLIGPYLWLFSEDNLRSTTVKHSLSSPTGETLSAARDQMSSDWQNLHTYTTYGVGNKSLYQASLSKSYELPAPLPINSPGLNQQFDFAFNSAYALPVYECIGIPFLFFLPIPVCWTDTLDTDSSQAFDPIYFDFLPATLDGFTDRVDRGAGVYALAWDPQFDALTDIDGDGLLGRQNGGLDPDDLSWDTDGDGLSDSFELEKRAGGTALSAIFADSDLDGLTDAQELQAGTNPGRADTDNDGLPDGVEVRHLEGLPSSPHMVGGWTVAISGTASGPNPLTVIVSSNPLSSDSDGDGISDQAEKELAESTVPADRFDDENRPYHPNVVNSAPIAIYLATDDGDGFVHPGQSVAYTTTVVAKVPLAPSVLDVTMPVEVDPSPVPDRLDFDPLTFTNTQTVTRQISFAAPALPASQPFEVSSDVRARLQDQAAPVWSWTIGADNPLTRASLYGGITAAPINSGRLDDYLITTMESSRSRSGGQGDIFSFPFGDSTIAPSELDVDDYARPRIVSDYSYLRGEHTPSTACNEQGECMTVWDHIDNCQTLKVHDITLRSTVGAVGVSPYQPIVMYQSNPEIPPEVTPGNTLWPGDYGPTDPPLAFGDQIAIDRELEFCGPTYVFLAWWSSNVNDIWAPISDFDALNCDNTSSCHTLAQINTGARQGWLIEPDPMGLPYDNRAPYYKVEFQHPDLPTLRADLRVSLGPPKSQMAIGASITNEDGQVQTPQFSVDPLVQPKNPWGFRPLAGEEGQQWLTGAFKPTVTTNGDTFLVTWMEIKWSTALALATPHSGSIELLPDDPLDAPEIRIVTQLYDGDGAALWTNPLEIYQWVMPQPVYRDLTTAFYGYIDPNNAGGIPSSAPTVEIVNSPASTYTNITTYLEKLALSFAEYQISTDRYGTAYGIAFQTPKYLQFGYGNTITIEFIDPADGSEKNQCTLTDDAAENSSTDFDVAYSPASDLALTIFQGGPIDSYGQGEIGYSRLSHVSEIVAGTRGCSPSSILSATRGSDLHIEYYPPTQGWVQSWKTSSYQRFQVSAIDANGYTELANARFSAAVTVAPRLQYVRKIDTTLACPAGTSAPVLDLRFEELPQTGTFADSSGYGLDATAAIGFSMPAAGYPGALDAGGNAVGSPPSDFAVRFASDNQESLVVEDSPIGFGNFTIAFWIKANGPATGNIVSDDSIRVGLQNGSISYNGRTFNAPVDDGEWHAVVLTREETYNLTLGLLHKPRLYIDGHEEFDLTPRYDYYYPGDLVLGPLSGVVDLDELQIYPIAIDAATISDMYAGQIQSYCLFAGTDNQVGGGFPFARLRLNQSDIRGGRIAASNSLNLTVDVDKPTSALEGYNNGDFVNGGRTLIIGGSATDPGADLGLASGIAKVEVSTDGGATWNVAEGAESWIFALPVTNGNYTILTRATDAVGNIEASRPGHHAASRRYAAGHHAQSSGNRPGPTDPHCRSMARSDGRHGQRYGQRCRARWCGGATGAGRRIDPDS